MFDLFYDNMYAHDNVCIRQEKFRLYKCVDRKGNFLWWEWSGEDNIATTDDDIPLFNPERVNNLADYFALDDKYKMETTSGFADFTPDGSMLELTEEQRSRALTRKVKL